MRYRLRWVFVAVLVVSVGVMAQDRGIGGTAASHVSPGESRVALVIGNAAYPNARLRNPVNDAEDVAEALRACGFDVIEKTDCTYEAMDRAVLEFGERVRGGNVALFFYAGHGIQVKGQNFLVPVDAKVTAENEIKYRCVNAGLVLAKMESAGSRVNIVILDACRNNPFARSWRSDTHGLAVMDAAEGTIISYATAPGSVAADGSGRNSVYTENLLKHVHTPGLPIERVFKSVRVGVAKATENGQIPWENSSLMGDFYFRVPTDGKPAVIAPPPPVPEPLVMTGHLQVNTNVPDARVTVDGKEAGTAAPGNPVNMTNIPSGTLQVQVSALGYESESRNVAIRAHEWTQEAFELAKVVATQAPTRVPSQPDKSSTSALRKSSDNRFTEDANDVILDSKTGLEWYAGPDKNMNWDEAKSWVKQLEVAGRGWRMPTSKELKGLHQEGVGKKNLDPLFRMTGLSVWTGETRHGSNAWLFRFLVGKSDWDFRDNSNGIRAFAVRSRR